MLISRERHYRFAQCLQIVMRDSQCGLIVKLNHFLDYAQRKIQNCLLINAVTRRRLFTGHFEVDIQHEKVIIF